METGMSEQSGKGYSESVTISLPIADAYQRCVSAAEAIPRGKLKQADESERRVELKTGLSIKSWGERMVLELESQGEAATSVQVSSRSWVPTTLVDYGKNRDNVERVIAWLRDGETSAQAPGPS
jgi:hypothetical protein